MLSAMASSNNFQTISVALKWLDQEDLPQSHYITLTFRSKSVEVPLAVSILLNLM